MKKRNILTYTSSDKLDGKAISLRYIEREADHADAGIHIHDAHRHDYYLFFFLEKGYTKLLIDFEECEVNEDNAVLCILPGQVHLPVNGDINTSGWMMSIDSMLVKDEYKKVFEKLSFLKTKPQLSKETIDELKQYLSLISKRFKSDTQQIEQNILHDLVSSYVGTIAKIYQRSLPPVNNNRHVAITLQFKSLLSNNYQTLKHPSQYASQLNISTVYLNEVVKKTTGFSVRDNIQNEIIIQAKRLLFYTNLSIKEIALNLGYEDWAYFTRLFSKSTKQTPSQFRRKYLE